MRRALEWNHRAIKCAAFDPALEKLAGGGLDGTVTLWDTIDGKLLRTFEWRRSPFEWRRSEVASVAFDPTGRRLACGSASGTVNLWDTANGELLHTFPTEGRNAASIAFDAAGHMLASGTDDGAVNLWDANSGKLLRTFRGPRGETASLVFDPTGRILAKGGADGTVIFWDTASGTLSRLFENYRSPISSIGFEPSGGMLAIGSLDNTVKLWDVPNSRLRRILEGHRGSVVALSFHKRRPLFATMGWDDTIRIWNSETWDVVAVIQRHARYRFRSLRFHPSLPRLAAAGARLAFYELDLEVLLGERRRSERSRTVHYANAKVVLVGDTGVGKTGLSLVLGGRQFAPTDSTAGRQVWALGTSEDELPGERRRTRETLLWDLAGQPGYRVIHQLHLSEVAVALVVFDARSETDPLAGVIHWERALRAAHQRQGEQAVPLAKFLVSARADRGGVPVSKERLEALVKEFNFAGYYATSAKEGWQIDELRTAIEDAIPWDELPTVTSSELFATIKSYLLEAKETGRLLVPAAQLFHEFARQHPEATAEDDDLRADFDVCIGRLENRDLIRRLSFGDYVLLQPELLDAYASALVIAARNEPDGLGSIDEEMALTGHFHVPEDQRISDSKQEQLLLHATVEELVRYDLALRESAADGRYLAFPSQFNRDYAEAPDPPGKAVAVSFEGPTQSIYATLAVRLGHSQLFETARTEMWRNAVLFTAHAGGKCGIYLQELGEGRGRLLLFFDGASEETRFHFEEYALAHVGRRALHGTVQLVRLFVCENCSTPVPDPYVSALRSQGKDVFSCPCGGTVSIVDPGEVLARRYPSQVAAMDLAADRQRDFDAFVLSANAETHSSRFVEWAGDERVTLAIVFTDVVGSTALGERMRDERMYEVQQSHFAQSRKLIVRYKGYEIRTIGDSVMAAFRSVAAALDYARALYADPGAPELRLRAGIHIGPLQIEEGDVFGRTVNFAARVVSAIKGAEIWLSEQAKADIDVLGARRHEELQWHRHNHVELKGFAGTFTLWSIAHA
ncbi:MAG TPA: adenylate/guanylate cyclase domain-containing protein [Stellaceae bacterium]|nr:adenylate/guanylate cyclase domain-containing protein [Stellaceae bacterium]